MCILGSVCRVSVYLKRLASSMNGRFWHSVNSFHSAPRRFDISELCIFGLSCAIFRRCPRDHTIKAFIGRFIWSDWDFNSIWDMSMGCLQSLGHRTHTLEKALLSIVHTFQFICSMIIFELLFLFFFYFWIEDCVGCLWLILWLCTQWSVTLFLNREEKHIFS